MGLGTSSWKDTLILTMYLLLVLYVGLRALSRDRSTIKGFFLADQNLTWWLIGASLFAANIGNSHFIGMAGIGASSGITIGAFEWNTIFMLLILGWVFVPIYIKAGVVTLPEYLRKRFGSIRLQVLVSILAIFIDVICRILVEICYGAMFLKIAWDLDAYQIILILLAIAGTYTVTGGLAAMIYTETLHATIMLFGSTVLMVYAFGKVGGYKQLQHNYIYAIPGKISEGNWTAKSKCYIPHSNAFHLFLSSSSGDFSWPELIFGATTLSLFYGSADQVSVLRALAGKNISHIKIGFILYGYLKLLPMFLVVMPGMISRTFYPDQVACVVPSECEKHCGAKHSCSPVAYPRLVISLLPTGLQGLMLAAVCATIISSLTSAFNSISALFTMNIYTWLRPRASENELMITARFFIISLLATAIIWIPITETAYSEKLFEYMLMTRSCLTPPITALFILAVFSKRVNEEGAFWGLSFGIMIGFCRMLPELIYGHRTCEDQKCPQPFCSIRYLYFSMPLLVVSLISMLVISFFRHPIPEIHLHRLCWSLRKSQDERVDLDQDRTWKRLPRFPATPTMFRHSQSYFWEALQLYFGLEPQLKSTVTPKKASKEINATEEKRGGMLENSSMKRVISASGTILITLVVLGHVYFA
uniref:Uncharacterized protein n=1 Tax=Cavia porcellus TaxID=10141 RepID=H0W482_CAVPO